jgi:hypothetical protein
MCSVEGCRNIRVKAHGLCHAHYMRVLRTRSLQLDKRLGPSRLNEEPTPHDECHFVITRYEMDRFREQADRIIAANNAAAARYRMQNARDDAAEHQVAAA